ncbi:hypothetical protein [Paenibacillus tyrfis]|uniref:hypothetical protein n=1 Tax=Paenibacillus tyrfis TaxID=1501230 RepID=UPI0020A0E09E|nr:hypothetical protein [Paenibacillus tyrfis]MCP1312576.1 hypothetical protein [Paenibacillus tyrfis]
MAIFTETGMKITKAALAYRLKRIANPHTILTTETKGKKYLAAFIAAINAFADALGYSIFVVSPNNARADYRR